MKYSRIFIFLSLIFLFSFIIYKMYISKQLYTSSSHISLSIEMADYILEFENLPEKWDTYFEWYEKKYNYKIPNKIKTDIISNYHLIYTNKISYVFLEENPQIILIQHNDKRIEKFLNYQIRKILKNNEEANKNESK
ncbi:MAG: hypothetical protein SFY92_11190 [Verrucomicrobiae bacterium]|nr:hypothetical protein [Verrucomicrobiae bacterium]